MQSSTTHPWSIQSAKQWHDSTDWLIGCNYLPRTAINQLEMWQEETFDETVLKEELQWAGSLGFNTVRVFLHDLLWKQDPAGFLDRIDRFLEIAARNGVGAMLVFFDSCWHPFPRLGKQPEPEPGVHNPGWLQSPGVPILKEASRFAGLEDYVKGVMTRFANDSRVQIWDIWNEPDNPNTTSRGSRDLGEQKAEIVLPYLKQAFQWAREALPSQPLTSAIWLGDWRKEETMKPLERAQIELSDVVSFHNYNGSAELEQRIVQLQRYDRPLICSEFMARPTGSTFQDALPVLKRHGVGAYCWGFVTGRSQTRYAWRSWQEPYEEEPKTWFHDVLHSDGSPYCQEEASFLRSITGTVK